MNPNASSSSNNELKIATTTPMGDLFYYYFLISKQTRLQRNHSFYSFKLDQNKQRLKKKECYLIRQYNIQIFFKIIFFKYRTSKSKLQKQISKLLSLIELAA